MKPALGSLWSSVGASRALTNRSFHAYRLLRLTKLLCGCCWHFCSQEALGAQGFALGDRWRNV